MYLHTLPWYNDNALKTNFIYDFRYKTVTITMLSGKPVPALKGNSTNITVSEDILIHILK